MLFSQTPHRDVTEVWVAGTHIMGAQARLQHAVSIVEQHLQALAATGTQARYIGTPFRVHVTGGYGRLLDEGVCRVALEHVAEHGERAGVVILWHGHLDAIIQELAPRSARLLVALADGRVCRHVASYAPILEGPGAAFEVAQALLSACMSMMSVDDPAAIAACLAESAGGAEVCRAMAASLRSAADLLDLGVRG